MRTFIFLCCSISFALSTNKSFAQNADIAIKKDRTLNVKQAFKLINKQTDYKFIYRSDLLKNAPELFLEKGTIKAKILLDRFLGPINFTYAFTDNNTIVVKRMPATPIIKDSDEEMQQQVSGSVVDGAGVPLPGATIIVKGTTNGTQTDFDGNFSIEVADSNAVLVISYVGFKAQEIVVGDQAQINVKLQEDSSQLDEVVVVGYGTVRKADVTAAITSVAGDEVNITKESNPLDALAGKAAGVDIRFTTNAPGTSPEVLIRGRSSLSFSNDPLFVVDGIPVSSGLADFNPNDIESIDVLKDASATAIYGARGANGVVLITTKRGKVGRTEISYDAYYGFSEPFERIPMMNAQQWSQLRLESLRTVAERNGDPGPSLEEGLFAPQLEAFNAGIDTDWQDLLLQSGLQQNHQIGVLGGTEKVRYNVSMNYFEQEGIIQGSAFERLTLRTNIDVNATERLKLGLSQQVAFSDRENRRHGSLINVIFQSLPLVRPFEEDGTTPTTDPLGDGNYWNPLNDLVDGNYIDNDRFFNYFANIFASYQLSDSFKFTFNFGPELRFERSNDWRSSQSTVGRGGENRARKFNKATTSYNIDNIFDYKKTFNDKHRLDATVFFNVQDIQEEETSAEVRGVQAESFTFNNLSDSSAENRSVDSKLERERWTSIGGRFSYTYKNKYILGASARYDASNKLAPGNKWAFFPGVSGAWVISQEDFLSNSKTINFLKVRVGYGTSGRNTIPAFSTQGTITRTEGSFDDVPAFGFRPDEIANPDLTWEITSSLNAGLDFGFFNNRVSGTFDYYNGKTTDLLLNQRLPSTSGFTEVLRNVGETQNKGFEITLNTVNVKGKDFSWSTNFNFSQNRSTIAALADGNTEDIGNRWFVGEQQSVYFDRVFDGIWQLDEAEEAESFGREVGQIKLADLNEDGQINDDDRRIVGFRDPQWTAGLTNTINFKGFDFSVVALTRQGHTIRQRALFANNSLVGRSNNVLVDYWTPENPSNSFPRPDDDRQGPRDEGASNYFDGSYIRIRNITLGYSFNEIFLNTIGLQKLRFYVTAQNPFLFRSDDRLIDGVDPDVADGGTDDTDEWLPSPRTILFGLSTTF
ncbi:TonB-dependent receptor [Flagellimonas sp. HMM57]|uniref:SusC/RagA family TonB-linked outer membrane protein n=1 Tax=unclassified Flagellimonas TaxID=2644544 RepID=UPI0013D55CCF|nr:MULTISPECIES: TonB-dependent receptor [unclassified Flagellimonas]UII77663.1 TonB-dependent receptor [Flagellimonas sp. HMM57]